MIKLLMHTTISEYSSLIKPKKKEPIIIIEVLTIKFVIEIFILKNLYSCEYDKESVLSATFYPVGSPQIRHPYDSLSITYAWDKASLVCGYFQVDKSSANVACVT